MVGGWYSSREAILAFLVPVETKVDALLGAQVGDRRFSWCSSRGAMVGG